jgi:hypothetical protein
MNPILDKALDLIRAGKVPQRIIPEKTLGPNKRVTFVFIDGHQEVLETEADHDQFMNWWNVAGSYFRECANAFDARP